MATTVTYKGQTLATVENQTKVLQTAGTWCEDDFTLTDVSGGGTTEPEEKDVDFIDYDGTLLYSYTAEDFLQMTELPPNPTREGLIAQGWNWTLADAKEVVEKYGFHVIGQNYTTDDGSTRVYYTNDELTVGKEFFICIRDNEGVGVTIDWGDGTTTTTPNNTNFNNSRHRYDVIGDYVIRIIEQEGTTYDLGYNGSNRGAFYEGSSGRDNAITSLNIRKVEIGSGCRTLHRQCFIMAQNRMTEGVSIPRTVTTFGSGTTAIFMNNAPSMIPAWVIPPNAEVLGQINLSYFTKYISLPNITVTNPNINYGQSLRKYYVKTSATAIGNNVINGGYMIRKLAIEGSYTTLNSRVCQDAPRVSDFHVPATVTEIKDYAFTNSWLTLHMKPTTPPTLANIRTINTVQKIIVPQGSLSAYQTATNWSNYASIMEEESA